MASKPKKEATLSATAMPYDLPWYASIIFKSPEIAREWVPKLEERRKWITPEKYHQTIGKMPLMDFDAEFALDPEPNVIATGFENSEGIEITLSNITKQMFQMSSGELTFVSTCKCGYLTGNYNRNTTCPKCGSVCRSAFADEVSFGGWIVIPETLPPFLHPAAYRVLRAWMGNLSKRKYALLDAILDPEMELPEPYKGVIGQGMAYLAEGNNLENVCRFIADQRKGKRTTSDESIFRFIETYRHCLFTRHIPLLNQALHIITQSGTMDYSDDPSEFILKTYLELSSVIYDQRHRTNIDPMKLQKRVWSVYSTWMQYLNAIIKSKLRKKSGFIRKCMMGSRMHFTARAVIRPIVRDHSPHAIELPWRMIIGLYKLEITNILQNRYGYDVNEACKLFNNAIVEYSPIIDTCLKTLLDECPFVGLPILMGRNPTLRHGGIQLWFCSKYTKDPNNNTVGMSPECLKCPNADFD